MIHSLRTTLPLLSNFLLSFSKISVPFPFAIINNSIACHTLMIFRGPERILFDGKLLGTYIKIAQLILNCSKFRLFFLLVMGTYCRPCATPDIENGKLSFSYSKNYNENKEKQYQYQISDFLWSFCDLVEKKKYSS